MDSIFHFITFHLFSCFFFKAEDETFGCWIDNLLAHLIENLLFLQLGLDTFDRRHLGPADKDVAKMCKFVGVDGLEDLVNKSMPVAIHTNSPTRLGKPLTESETLTRINEIASLNKVYKSYLGLGYYPTITPPVILRNVMENPGWYTQVFCKSSASFNSYIL